MGGTRAEGAEEGHGTRREVCRRGERRMTAMQRGAGGASAAGDE